MPALTEADQEWLTANTTVGNIPMPPESSAALNQPTFKYDPDATDLGLMNMFRMVGNLPSSGWNIAKAAAEAGKDPLEVGRILIKSIAGSGEEAARRLGLQGETENTQLFRQLGRFYIDRITNPGRTLVEDPFGIFMDLSPLGRPLAGVRAGASATRVGQGLQAANPLRTIPKAAVSTGKGVAELGVRGGSYAADFFTGFPGRYYQQGTKAVRAGGSRAKQFYGALRENIGPIDVLDDFRSSINRVKETRRIQYQAQLPKLKLTEGTLSLKDVRVNLLDKLKDDFRVNYTLEDGRVILDFSDSTLSATGPQRRIQRLVNEIYDWNDISVQGLDILKQRIGDIHEPGTRFARSNVIVDETYDSLRNLLIDNVDGYKKLVGDYEFLSNALADFDRILGGGSINPETALSKMTSVLRESPTAELRNTVIQQLEELSGKPIVDQIAGLELSQKVPKNLVGRSIAAGALMGGALEVEALFPLLRVMPFTSPRLVGEFFGALGYGAKQVDKITKLLEKIHAALPATAITEGLTIATAIKKAQMASSPFLDPIQVITPKERSLKLATGPQAAKADVTVTPTAQEASLQDTLSIGSPTLDEP